MPRASRSPDQPVRWHVVVPVKESDRAKSRLAAPHPLSRPALASAVAEDTLEQVCRALPPAQVIVVTSDRHAREVAGRLGAQVVSDPGAGLNAAVRAGLASTADAEVQSTTSARVGSTTDGGIQSTTDAGVDRGRPGWAVLLGDLPALRAADLRTALERCAAHPACVVPDADGTGTVLLTSTVGPPEPRFGSGSAARHAVDATRLELDLPRLRRDVDTATDLAHAVTLGVGPRTAEALGLGGA